MSTQIDERVVQMKFDSKNFDQNVAETIKELNRFESKLKLLGAQQGMGNVQKAVDSMDFNPLLNGADRVTNRFDVMSVACIAAVNNLTNKVVDSAERMVKSLSVDQVSAGWTKYAEKTSAVQTIMAATAKNFEDTGEQMAFVNAELDKLNWFTDETSYSFLDMVNNIGKFTSNNVGLRESVTAMQGISTWAAISGANVTEAGRAMYNLSQAMATGTVKLIDWKSIENANMATAEFKETVIETAAEMGLLVEKGEGIYGVKGAIDKTNVSVSNFNEDLSHGWFTADVLMKTLDQYGRFATDLYRVTENLGGTATDWLGWIDDFKAGTFDVEEAVKATNKDADSLVEVLELLSSDKYARGLKAFRAAQEAKTFAEAIDSVKDAVSTGWMNTFEIIFGDYEKAKKLWTGLANELYDIFAESGWDRNNMFEQWAELGGREDLFAGIAQGWNNIKDIIGAVKDAFDEMFPPMTGEKLANLTEGFLNFTKQVKLSEGSLTTLKNTIKLILVPVKVLWELMKTGGVLMAVLAMGVVKVVDSFGSLVAGTKTADNIFRKMFGDDRYERMVDKWADALERLGAAFSTISARIGAGISSINLKFGKSDKLQRFFQAVYDILAPMAGWLLDALVEGVEELANIDFSKISDFADRSLKNMLDNLKGIGGVTEKFAIGVEKFFNKIKSTSPEEALDSLVGVWYKILDFPKQAKSFLSMSTVYQTLNSHVQGLSDVFNNLGESMAKMLSRLSAGNVLLFSFGVSLVGALTSVTNIASLAGNALKGFGTILTNTGKLLGAWYDKIRYDRVRQLAAAILALSVALLVLATVDSERLKGATNAMIGLIAALGGIIGFVAVLDKFVLKDSKTFARLSTSIASIAIAISLMVGVFSVLLLIPTDGVLLKLGVILVIMGALVAVAKSIGKMPATLSYKVTLTLIPFVFALSSVVNALRTLAKMDLVSILKGLIVLPAVMIELVLVLKAMKKIKKDEKLVSVIFIGLSILALGKALEMVGGLNFAKMLTGVVAMTVVMTDLLIFAKLTKKLDSDISAVTKSMLNLAIAISAISLAVYMLGNLDTRTVLKGTLIVGALIILMGVFGKLMSSKYGGEHAASVGKSFTSMAIAIDLMVLAIHYLGSLPLKIVLQGTLVVSMLMGMFSLIMLAAKSAQKGTANIIAITAALGMVMAAIALLTLIPAEQAMANAKALSLVMASLGLAIGAAAHGNKKDGITDLKTMTQQAIGNLENMAAFIIGATAAIAILNVIPIKEGLLTKVEAFTLMVIGLTSAMLIMSKVKGNETKPEDFIRFFLQFEALVVASLGLMALLHVLPIDNTIFEKIAAFAEVIGVMIVAMYAMAPMSHIKLDTAATVEALNSFVIILGYAVLVLAAIGMVEAVFTKYGGDLNSFLQTGIPLLETIGSAIGRMFGALVGGFSGAVVEFMTAKFPVIGTNMSKFAENSAPFFEAMKDIKKDSVDGMWNAVACFTALTAADFLTNIVTLGGKLGNVVSISEDLKEAAPNMRDFANSMSDVTGEGLEGAKIIGEIVSNLADGLKETSTGIFAAFTGQKSISGLASELAEAGPDLKIFANCMAEVKGSFWQAKQMVDVIQKFAEITPTQGGKLQKLTGEKNLELFGSQLEKFGISFSNFDMWMRSVKGGEAFDLAMRTAQLIADFANTSVPTTGGIVTWFEDNDLSVFGRWIESFGKSLGEFDKYVQDIDDGILNKADLVREAVNKILEADWGETFFESGVKTGQVIENLKVYLHGMSEFAKQATDENYDLNNIGSSSIKELVDGIESALPKLEAIADTVPRTLVIKAKDILGCLGGTSSSEFFTIGKYVIQGFTKGLQNSVELENLNAAALAMAEGVLNTVLEYNKIQSPSVLYKEEVGVFIVKGIAEGIKSDTSAEEAAKQKAQNIANAFKSALESSEIQLALRQAQYELWGSSTGLVADEQTQNQMKSQNFIDRLKAQAEATKSAEGAYLAAVKTLGEGHNETIKLQTEFIKAQNEGYKLAKEFAEFNASMRDSSISARDAAREYYNYMASDEVKKMLEGGISQADINAYAAKKFGYEGSTNAKQYYDYMNSDTVKKMLEGGMSQEEIEKYAKEKFGYSAGRGMLTGLDETLTNGYNGTDIQSIYDHFFSGDVKVQIVKEATTTGKAVGAGYVSGVQSGVTSGTEQLQQIVDDPLGALLNGLTPEDIKNAGEELGENIPAGITSGITSFLGDLRDKGKEMINNVTGGVEEAAEINSPSKLMEREGGYYVQGFINGMDGHADKVKDAGIRMIEIASSALTDGGEFSWNTQMYEAGGYFMQAFASGFADSYDHLQMAFSEAIAKLLTAVIETHPNWTQNGFDCGKMMMYGIVDGVETGKSAAINAIVKAATEAYQAACDAIGLGAGNISVSATTTAATAAGVVAGSGSSSKGGIKASTSSRSVGTVAVGLKANTSTQLGSRISELAAMHDENGNLKKDSKTPATVTNNYTFNQTNNSPKAISAYDSYKLGKSGMAKFKLEVKDK